MSLFIAIYPLTHPIIAKWNTPPPPHPDSYLITLASTLRGQTKECTALISFYHFFFNSLFFFIKKRYVWNAICFTWRSPNSDRSSGITRIVEIYKKSEVVDMGIPHVSMIKRNLSIKEILSKIHFLDTFLAAVICHYSRKSPNVSCTNDTSDTRQN